MNQPFINVLIVDYQAERQQTRNVIPSIKSALASATIKSHEVEIDLVADALLATISNLGQIAQAVSQSKGEIPSKITFSLGIDSNGSIGILSTLAASITHTASISVEFDIKRS